MKKTAKETTKKTTKKSPDKAGNVVVRDNKGKFVKGNPGNPNGRPRKAICIPDLLRKVGDEECNLNGAKIPKIEAVVREIYKQALKGKQSAIDFIAERTEGKVADKVLKAEAPIDFIVD